MIRHFAREASQCRRQARANRVWRNRVAPCERNPTLRIRALMMTSMTCRPRPSVGDCHQAQQWWAAGWRIACRASCRGLVWPAYIIKGCVNAQNMDTRRRERTLFLPVFVFLNRHFCKFPNLQQRFHQQHQHRHHHRDQRRIPIGCLQDPFLGLL